MEKSLNEETYEKLKYDIMNFEVLPGDSISAQKIALRYNVSRTPAREAIVNLEKEGLLKVIPQSGTYVACINCKRSEQEWFVRKSLEIGMVDAIFKNASADMLDKMAEMGVIEEGITVDKFEQKDGALTLDLSSLKESSDKLVVMAIANTFIQNYEAKTLELSVAGEKIGDGPMSFEKNYKKVN